MKNNTKVRIDEVVVQGYYFPGVEGLYWHSGEFWWCETKCKKVCNNGSLSVLVGSSKRSIKQLRKIAAKCTIKIEKQKLPF